MGVRALGVSLAGLLSEYRRDARISFVYGHHSGRSDHIDIGGRRILVEVVNHRLSPRSRPREHLLWIVLAALLHRLIPSRAWRQRLRASTPCLDAIARADFVGDIRAGDSFSDLYSPRRNLMRSIPFLVANLMGRRPVLLPQTYGPFRPGWSRALARFVLRRASPIYYRDRDDDALIRDLVGDVDPAPVIRFCPDVAFTLPAQPPQSSAVPLRRGGVRARIGFNVSGFLCDDAHPGRNRFGLRCDYRSLVRELLLRLLDETDGEILMLPHVFASGAADDDLEACRRMLQDVPTKLRHRLDLLEAVDDPREIKGFIGTCDFLIAARMHACIAALSQAIPAVAIAYSGKFAGTFSAVDAAHLVQDARVKTAEEIIAACLREFAARDATAAHLAARVPSVQAEVRAQMRRAFDGARSR